MVLDHIHIKILLAGCVAASSIGIAAIGLVENGERDATSLASSNNKFDELEFEVKKPEVLSNSTIQSSNSSSGRTLSAKKCRIYTVKEPSGYLSGSGWKLWVYTVRKSPEDYESFLKEEKGQKFVKQVEDRCQERGGNIYVYYSHSENRGIYDKDLQWRDGVVYLDISKVDGTGKF